VSTYGTPAGVAAYVTYMTNTAGSFDDAGGREVSLATVNSLLGSVSAQLTGWLAGAGYVTPVTQADAKAVLDRYANLGAAGYCELGQRVAGTSDDENARESKFLAEFAKAEAWINGRALAALGVPQAAIGASALHQPAIGAITAGTASDATRASRPPEWRITRWD
jgi:hypothetical protein